MSTSLYERLLPRWHFFLWTVGAAASEGTTSSPPSSSDRDGHAIATATTRRRPDGAAPAKPPSFEMLAKVRDDTFCRSLGSNLDAYEKFKNETIPQLKFASQFDIWPKTGRPIDLWS